MQLLVEKPAGYENFGDWIVLLKKLLSGLKVFINERNFWIKLQ